MSTQLPKILAIDDTPANLITLGTALEQNFELQFATSGSMGLALALAAPPDLILLDIMMPEMDGFETCRKIRAEAQLRNIPVIFITALSEPASEKHGLALGAADYITKPINVAVARQRISNLLEREQLRREVEAQRNQLLAEVSERQKAQDALRKMSAAVEQSAASIVITNLEAIIEYVNPGFTAVTGYGELEAIGQNPRILQSGQMPRENYVAMWDALTKGQPWHGELLNKRKNGQLYWEESHISPIRDETGAVSHFVAVKTEITERKSEQLALQTALKDKVFLLHEVHHRVKNNLQVISSLLNLESLRSEHPAAKAVLKDMQGRIASMGLLHETLYRSSNFTELDLGVYLRDLTRQAFRAMNTQDAAVRLEENLASIKVGIDQATPCGLLVNELISNSFKHGFPDNRSGVIQVELNAVPDTSQVLLSISDSGVGLPSDFETRRKSSLGLSLASDLARQIGGVLEIETTPRTRFSVQFSVHPKKAPKVDT
jgi:PAS domain S-box-containing protein